MASLLKLRTTPIARRFLSVLVLVAVCLATLPVPVPVVAAVYKDRSIPFPCQDRPCGCRDAKQCWTTCGCMSKEEKLRWAESRGISPPSYAVSYDGTNSNCCASIATTAACCSKASSASNNTCGKCMGSKNRPKRPTISVNDAPQQIMLLTSYIAKCNGDNTLIASLPWSIIAKPWRLVATSRDTVWQWVNGDERFLSAQADPPIPPPRLF